MKWRRHPAYKTVEGCWWIADIPLTWGFFQGKRFFWKQKELNTGMQCENRLALTMSGVVPRSLDDVEGLQALEFETYQIFEPGDLAFKLIDLQNIKTSRVGFVPEKGIMSPAYIRLAPQNTRVSSRYAYWYYTDLYNRTIFNQLGGGVRQTLAADELLTVPVPEPSRDEQAAIVTFLNHETAKIDTLIAKQGQLIELLQEKRQALITHAVTKGLNPDAPMKDSGVEWIGEAPRHWGVRRVKTVSTFTTSGPRGWSERVGEMGNLFIQSGDLNDSLQIEFESAKRVRVENDAEAIRTELREGDVVVCITGAKTGNVAVSSAVPEKAYVNQHLCLIRPGKEVMPTFLGLSLKSKAGQTYFDLSQYGLKQGLSLENVRDATVLIPPLPEQVAIVDYLDCETTKLDTLIEKSRHSIELMREHRTALISAAVTGKIDVREFANIKPEASELQTA